MMMQRWNCQAIRSNIEKSEIGNEILACDAENIKQFYQKESIVIEVNLQE